LTADGFSSLGLDEPLLRAVRDAQYIEPTPIQRAAIPLALTGRDLIACAQTGTGKTAAFSLPMLQRVCGRVDNKPVVRGLILTPTRELATQIGASLEIYGRHLKLWHTVVFGGVSMREQRRELRQGVDILVATPGRLLDLLSRGDLALDAVDTFVLDEADRMLDMGFLPDVRRIIARLPAERQTLLFSATMPHDIIALARTMLRDPAYATTPHMEAESPQIEQVVHFVGRHEKRELLLKLLGQPGRGPTLVFSRTKHGASRLATFLQKRGVDADAIHGDKSQPARARALTSFRDHSVSVLVATDIAARGIDVAGISHVVNFDLPASPETYVHRIGRTGRAGARGVALSFCEPLERAHLHGIERLVGQRLACASGEARPPIRDTKRLRSRSRHRR
jgi:ATP-dependent RNA helicase RhlE